MTARPLTPDEARRVTTCPECDCPWSHHHRTPGLERGHWADGVNWCRCQLADETLTQVAALVAEREAAAWSDGYNAAATMAQCYGYTDHWPAEDEPSNPYEATP